MLMVMNEKLKQTRLGEAPTTPGKVMKAMDAFLAASIRNLEVSYDSEAEIDPTKQYIVAISHKTGLDVPIVIKALGDKLPLVISDQSVHHDPINIKNLAMLIKDPTILSIKLLGQTNFPPISYTHDGDEKKPLFNPGDVDEMVKAIEQGKSVVVAAHNPSDAIKVQDIHSVKPGYSAALLAHMTGAEILPVLVDIDDEGQGMLGRKDARVFVGKPYSIDADPDMGDMRMIAEKRSHGEIPTPEDVAEFSRLADVLRETGKQVLDSVARLDSSER